MARLEIFFRKHILHMPKDIGSSQIYFGIGASTEMPRD